MTTKALVLHSGGIDSTTCLYIAAKMFGRENVISLSVNYGQRHLKEIDAARTIAAHLGVEHEVAHITDMPSSMLTDKKKEIPNISYDEIEGVSPTYVPFRNGQLLSKVAARAQALLMEYTKNDDAVIFFGAHAEDAANWAYPDCTPEFIGAMANAIYIGTYHKVRLYTPLQWELKWGVIRTGELHGVPWKLTWSCYVGGNRHCGICPTCRSRKDAFVAAAVIDPTDYEV